MATAFVLLCVGVYQFVVVPMLERRDELSAQIDKANQDLSHSLNVVKKSKELAPRWTEINRAGLQRDASRAESQIYTAISAWARDAQLPSPGTKSDRTEKEKDFQRITIRVTGNGTMEQISKFLYHIQTSNIPVKIVDLTITPRKEATDDLTLQLGLATIFLPPEADKPQQTASAAEVR
jgi:hypothetical protein